MVDDGAESRESPECRASHCSDAAAQRVSDLGFREVVEIPQRKHGPLPHGQSAESVEHLKPYANKLCCVRLLGQLPARCTQLWV